MAAFVQTNYFATGSEARIYGHHTFSEHWRSKQQLAHIVGKQSYGSRIGLFFCRGTHLVFN